RLRSGHDGAAEALDARRALAGFGSAHGGRGDALNSRVSRFRRDRLPRRAKCQPGVAACGPWLRHGDGQDHHDRQRSAASGRRTRTGELSRRESTIAQRSCTNEVNAPARRSFARTTMFGYRACGRVLLHRRTIMTMNRSKFLGAGVGAVGARRHEPGGLGAIARADQDRRLRADVGNAAAQGQSLREAVEMVVNLKNSAGGVLGHQAGFPFYGSDIELQTTYILENLKKTFEAAGSSLDHVVKAQGFLTDLANFHGFETVWKRYLKVPPPRTTIGCTGLLVADTLL